MRSPNNRQTNAQQGVRGRANHPSSAPPTALCSALRAAASGGCATHGAAVPIFCTVNGTFSFRRDEKKMWGWNSGFWKLPRSDWRRPVRTKYAKYIPTLRLNLFCRSLRRGTFHRRKVPKGRWGVSMRPRPLATPQAPEGSQQSAPR